MSPEEREIFIGQVAVVIKRQNNSEIYPYYQDFLNDCAANGLDECAFNTQILPEAYNRVPKEINFGNYVVVFGERCYTTEQMGLMFFRYPAKSELYMEDKSLFKKDVREIENSDTTLELVQLFNSEKLIDRRYLKVIYHLNKKLPYRIGTFHADNIDVLLKRGFEDIALYKLIIKDFLEGYIYIWLEQTDPVNFAKLKGHATYHDFLSFIYSVDKTYPFFVSNQAFATPSALIAYTQQDKAFRAVLHKSISAGNVMVWFDTTDKHEWNKAYEPLATYINQLDDHSDSEKLALTIQALQQVLEPGLALPTLVTSENQIDFINIEGARPVVHVLNITAQNIGYVKASLHLKNISGDSSLPPGSIWIDTSATNFDSFENKTSISVIVTVEPLNFIKDQPYSFEIIITTLYQTISLPVNVKVVFPKKEYLIYLAKYAAFGIVFFILIRAIDKLVTDRQEYYPYIPTFAGIYNNFQDFYWKYIFVFIIMLCGIVLGYRLTKKVEKL